MANILVADTPAACTILQGVMRDHFTTQCVSRLEDVRSLVSDGCQGIGLVIAGCHFDDGRMYDVLRLMRATSWPRIPFVAIRTLQGELDDAVYEGVRIATRALDGDAFVDFIRWQRKYGQTQAEQRLVTLAREFIEIDPADVATHFADI